MNEKREPQNGMQYDAFISYKHEKRDYAVAAKIQKDLESFRIPDAIRKETGKKKIGRIFRDKNELSLTSDLGDEIQEALLASRFLIVICSLRTRESVWVSREIDFFLKTHDADHILTVIVEGEPEEVLPLPLLDRDREPLFADYRISRRKAKRQELPRIVAALLGCSYDDLVRRAQQYRRHRSAAAAAVTGTIGLIAVLYLVWSHIQILESYKQSQVNQAMYLTSEVESLLDRDRAVTAAQLAMYIVPEDKSLTPAQSWQALQDASGAYVPFSVFDPASMERVIGELHSSDSIQIIRENSDRTRICTADKTGHIHVWDAKTRGDILSFQVAENVRDIIFAGDMLVVGTDESLTGYDLSDGGKSWEMETGILPGDQSHSCLQADKSGEMIAVLAADRESGNRLRVIRAETGIVGADIGLPDSDSSDSAAASLAVTEDGQYTAFWVQAQEGKGRIQIYHADSGKLTDTGIALSQVSGMMFLENGSLLVRGVADEVSENDEQTALIESVTEIDSKSSTTENVYCIPAQTGEVKWESDIRYTQTDDLPMQAASFTCGEDSTKRDAVGVTAAGVFQIYDAQTGEKIQEYDFSDNISFIMGASDEAADIDGDFLVICADGSMSTINIGDDDIESYEMFQDNIGEVFYCDAGNDAAGYFVHDGNTVLQYSMVCTDPGFQKLTGSDQKGLPLWNTFTDDTWIVAKYVETGTQEPVVEIYDRKTWKLLKSFTAKNAYYDVDFLGLSKDQKNLVCRGSRQSPGVYVISLESEKMHKLPIPVVEDEDDLTKEAVLLDSFNCMAGEKRMLLRDDKIYYLSEEGYFCVCDINTQKIRSYKCLTDAHVGREDDGQVCAFSLSPDNRYAFVTLNDGRSLLLSTKDAKVLANIKTDDPMYTNVDESSGAVDWDMDAGYFAVAGERAVYLIDLNGKVTKEISYSGEQSLGLHFYKDMLLVACTDGRLKRYSVPDGKLLGTTLVSVYSGSMSTIYGTSWKFRKDGTLCLSLSDYLNVIDTGSWTRKYSAPDCIDIDDKKKQFLVYTEDSDGFTVGYFPEYTLDELIEKCEEAGNHEDLTEDLRARYGVTDD